MELEELQVRLQFRENPDVTKKISNSLKTTMVSRRTRVGHIFGIPAASSELTSLVCRVQERLAEEAIRSIHTNSEAKATKADQESDFAAEHKKLAQETNDHKREVPCLKELCARNKIDTSTRKQKGEREREQRASKENKPVKKSTVSSTTQPTVDDTAPDTDA